MADTGAVAIYVTCPTLAVAEDIAVALVEARLAAGVNMIPGAHSLYWWRGRIERADEIILIAKTMAARVEAATAAIVAAHPYETPAIVAFDIVAGSRPYLDWLRAEARGGG
jgi:periplasmic divalent cation tolerance protein